MILWNSETSQCMVPKKGKYISKRGPFKKKIFLIDLDGKSHVFLPEISAWPMTQELKMMKESHYRLFNLAAFEKDPHLFIFGKSIAYRKDGLWVNISFKKEKNLPLPWMNFKLALVRYEKQLYPSKVPIPVFPQQIKPGIIQGSMKSIRFRLFEKEYWLTDDHALALNINGKKVILSITKKTLPLDFKLSLERFEMKTDPGTNNPASYESFVRFFTHDGPSIQHIYMNHPYKKSGFTFYQASYFQTKQGPYGSVLSVNRDPGRWMKYLGALLLVLGTSYHYFPRRKKT